MIENNQLDESIIMSQLQRSTAIKNVTLEQLDKIENRSVVYFSYRNNDKTFVLISESEISPIGQFGLKLTSIEISKSNEDKNDIDPRALFQILKITENNKQLLKQNENFYLLHNFSGRYLSCKQTVNEMFIFEFKRQKQDKGSFYFLNHQDRIVFSNSFVSSNKKIKICSSVFQDKFFNIFPSHNIVNNTISLCSNFTLFNINIYKISDNDSFLIKTSYVEILVGNQKQKLKIKTKDSFLNSDLNQPYNQFFKPDNYQLTSNNHQGTIWKMQMKSSLNHKYGHISYGDQISFKCINTNLYLSYDESNNNFCLQPDSSNKASIFQIEKIIDKINQYSDLQYFSIWLQSPVLMNGNKIFFKQTKTLVWLPEFYNLHFQTALKCLEQFQKTNLNSSTNKYLPQQIEQIIRSYFFELSYNLKLFIQLYENMTIDIKHQKNKQILFSKSMIWLKVIAQKNLTLDEKYQNQGTYQVIQTQFQILAEGILQYIYTCISTIQTIEFEKYSFYQIIFLFFPKHKYIIRLIFLELEKQSQSKFGYNYLLATINFQQCLNNKFGANSIKILRQFYNFEHIKSNPKSVCLDNISINLIVEKSDKILAQFFINDDQVFICQIGTKLNSTIYDCIIIGLNFNNISDNDFQQILKVLKNIYLQEQFDNELKTFILYVFNLYLHLKVPSKQYFQCLKYGNFNNESKAFQMFISPPFQGLLIQSSKNMDFIIDVTTNYFQKKQNITRTKNILQFIEFIKEFLSFIKYYTILGNYTISRLVSMVQFILKCCEVLKDIENKQFNNAINHVKKQKIHYIKYQINLIQTILSNILFHQAHILSSWLLNPSKPKLKLELSNIKIKSFKLLLSINNQSLFTSIKQISMIANPYLKYTFINQKYFKKKQYSKIIELKKIITTIFLIFEKLQTTHDQSQLKNHISDNLQNMNRLIIQINSTTNLQDIIRQNEVYKQICELMLTKSIVNFDWKYVIQFLKNFIVNNPTNGRLLLFYKLQQLLLGDELDRLIIEMFMYAQSPQEILRLEKRYYLTNDIRHKINFFRILLILTNKLDQEQSSILNKSAIVQIIIKIKGLGQIIRGHRDIYLLGNQNPKAYEVQSQESLQLHKTIVYLFCQLSKNTPIIKCFLNKWICIQQIVEICSQPSQLYWQIIKPYLYVINNTLNQQHVSTINHVSLIVIRNFSSQLHKNVKTLTIYNDTFNQFCAWQIINTGSANFEIHFPLKDTQNGLTLFPKNDDHFWKLFFGLQQECIKFGLITFIKSLLEYHNKNRQLSNELINEIVHLNVLFEGIVWVSEQIERIKQEQDFQVSFYFIKKLLNDIISLIYGINPNAPKYERRQNIHQYYFEQDQVLQDESITSLKPLVRQDRKNNTHHISQSTGHDLRRIMKTQIQQKTTQFPIEISTPIQDNKKLIIQDIPITYHWYNLLLNLDLANVNNLFFLEQFLEAYSHIIQNKYNIQIQQFLFKLSQKLKTDNSQQYQLEWEEYFICKLKVLHKILQFVFNKQNKIQLQKDFQSFSLMIRDKFNFEVKQKCSEKILIEATSICTIYLSCVKDPTDQIKLLTEIFNYSNNELERLQLITKLISTSMNLGDTAFVFLSYPKLCQSYYISVIQLCLKEELSLENQELPIIFELLEVLLRFNLLVRQKVQSNVFDSQYFNLLCLLKNKIVKQRLLQHIHYLKGYTTLSPCYVKSMNDNQFSSYLLLILISIQNICQMIIPEKQKYLFNYSNDSFHLFYKQHLSQVQIMYKNKNVIVCYPSLFNNRNDQIKNFALNIMNEKHSFDITLKTAEYIQAERMQHNESFGIIQFINKYKEQIVIMKIISLIISTIIIATGELKYLDMNTINIVHLVFLFVALFITIFKCGLSIVRYLREAKFEKKLFKKRQLKNNSRRVLNIMYHISIILIMVLSFIYKFLTATLLIIILSEKVKIKMYDSITSRYTRKLISIFISIFSLFMVFYQLRYKYHSVIHINAKTFEQFFSQITLESNQQSLSFLLFYKVLIQTYVPVLFFSFLIIHKIRQMNTFNTFKCLVCQKAFNQNNFSKHSIHKLSNYISYFSFILSRQQSLNSLEQYTKMFIQNKDIGIFPE